MGYPCSKCKAESEKISETKRSPHMGTIADGAKFKCPECDHEETMAVY